MGAALILAASAGLAAGLWLGHRQAAKTENAARAEGEAQRATLEERLLGRDQRVYELQRELTQRQTELNELRLQQTGLEKKLSDAEARRESEAHAAAEKLKALEAAEARLKEAFRALSAQSLEASNKQFLELARETLSKYQEGAKGELEKRQQAIDSLVKPIRESLGKFDEKIEALEHKRTSAYSGLLEQVRALAETQRGLREETGHLVQALRAPQVRGRWGEMQLRRAVEAAGMLEYVDFTEQTSVHSVDAGRQRPDMIINLPNKKKIVVDAKAPLSAYLEALEADGPDAQAERLRAHAQQLRTHLRQLGGKEYWKQFDDTPEFVVLFLPGETFFSAALEQDPSLIEFGAEQKVIPATPTTLIALLKAVAYGWRQEAIAAEARQISEAGRDLYDRIGTFAGHLQKVGSGLDRAARSYNDAVGSLESRVLVSARRLKELHATTGKDLERISHVDTPVRSFSAEELTGPEAGTSPETDE